MPSKIRFSSSERLSSEVNSNACPSSSTEMFPPCLLWSLSNHLPAVVRIQITGENTLSNTTNRNAKRFASFILFAVAYTFGITSPNKTIIVVTPTTLIKPTTHGSSAVPSNHMSNKIVETKTTAMFTMLLPINTEANNRFVAISGVGCSSNRITFFD